MVEGSKGGEKLGNPLNAALALELLNLLHQVMQVLRSGCNHCQRNVRTFANATYDMIGRYPHYAGIRDGLGGRGVTSARECNRLREAVALGQYVNHCFLARQGEPVKLHPAVDHDEKRRCRVALSKQCLVRRERNRGGRRDDMLYGFRLEAAEHGNACNDLEVTGR